MWLRIQSLLVVPNKERLVDPETSALQQKQGERLICHGIMRRLFLKDHNNNKKCCPLLQGFGKCGMEHCLSMKERGSKGEKRYMGLVQASWQSYFLRCHPLQCWESVLLGHLMVCRSHRIWRFPPMCHVNPRAYSLEFGSTGLLSKT